MPTIRAPHTRENHYFRMLRATAQDRALSWRARGILAYLLSKPDGWECQEEDLIAEGGEGKHAVRAGLAELRAAGYLTVAREHDPATGAFRWVKTLHESPVAPDEEPAITRNSGNGPLPENQVMAKPATTRKTGDGPLPDLPSMVNRSIHIRENQERREEIEPIHPSPPPPAAPAPSAGWMDGGEQSEQSSPPEPDPASIARLIAAGAKSPSAIRSAARLPLARVETILAEDQARGKGIGASVRRCIAEAESPELSAAIAAAALPTTPEVSSADKRSARPLDRARLTAWGLRPAEPAPPSGD